MLVPFFFQAHDEHTFLCNFVHDVVPLLEADCAVRPLKAADLCREKKDPKSLSITLNNDERPSMSPKRRRNALLITPHRPSCSSQSVESASRADQKDPTKRPPSHRQLASFPKPIEAAGLGNSVLHQHKPLPQAPPMKREAHASRNESALRAATDRLELSLAA